MKKIIFALSLCFFAVQGFAHQDKVLKIKPNGKIEGYSKKYGEIWFVADKWRPSAKGTAVKFRVGNKVLDLPPCLAGFVNQAPKEQAKFLGSWYHDLKALPPYVSLELPIKNVKDGKYTLLFDIKKVKLIIVNKQIKVTNDEGIEEIQAENISPRNICSATELKNLNAKSLKK